MGVIMDPTVGDKIPIHSFVAYHTKEASDLHKKTPNEKSELINKVTRQMNEIAKLQKGEKLHFKDQGEIKIEHRTALGRGIRAWGNWVWNGNKLGDNISQLKGFTNFVNHLLSKGEFPLEEMQGQNMNDLKEALTQAKTALTTLKSDYIAKKRDEKVAVLKDIDIDIENEIKIMEGYIGIMEGVTNAKTNGTSIEEFLKEKVNEALDNGAEETEIIHDLQLFLRAWGEPGSSDCKLLRAIDNNTVVSGAEKFSLIAAKTGMDKNLLKANYIMKSLKAEYDLQVKVNTETQKVTTIDNNLQREITKASGGLEPSQTGAINNYLNQVKLIKEKESEIREFEAELGTLDPTEEQDERKELQSIIQNFKTELDFLKQQKETFEKSYKTELARVPVQDRREILAGIKEAEEKIIDQLKEGGPKETASKSLNKWKNQCRPFTDFRTSEIVRSARRLPHDAPARKFFEVYNEVLSAPQEEDKPINTPEFFTEALEIKGTIERAARMVDIKNRLNILQIKKGKELTHQGLAKLGGAIACVAGGIATAIIPTPPTMVAGVTTIATGGYYFTEAVKNLRGQRGEFKTIVTAWREADDNGKAKLIGEMKKALSPSMGVVVGKVGDEYFTAAMDKAQAKMNEGEEGSVANFLKHLFDSNEVLDIIDAELKELEEELNPKVKK